MGGYHHNRYESAWNIQSSYELFWKSYGYHHNRYENQPGTFKVLMDYIGNLQVTSKIGTRKTPGTTTVPIGYFGNLMVTITNDMKISLGHVQFLWIILAIFRSPTKSVFIVEILRSPSQPI